MVCFLTDLLLDAAFGLPTGSFGEGVFDGVNFNRSVDRREFS